MKKIIANIALILGLIAGVYTVYQLYERVKEFNAKAAQNAEKEKQLAYIDKKLSPLNSDGEKNSLRCEWFESKKFNLTGELINADVLQILSNQLSAGQVCLELKRAEAVNECEAEAVWETHSCRAYDKSGFHSSPSANCRLSLSAGEGKFFNQNSVDVVSQFYRQRGGGAGSMSPSRNDAGLVTRFSGQINCASGAGTGRTCEAKATVRAKAYPIRCVEILKSP